MIIGEVIKEGLLKDAVDILVSKLESSRGKWVFITPRRKGAPLRVVVTSCPHYVEALDLLKAIEPDQALVDVLRAHLKDRSVLGGGAG